MALRFQQRSQKSVVLKVLKVSAIVAFMCFTFSSLCNPLSRIFAGRKAASFKSSNLSNPLTDTAATLQHLLTTRELTSVELVEQYICQIKRHDPYLKAVLAISPVALEEARRLDMERHEGKIRGPLHGIPIIIKDNIATDPRLGMDTTAGSFALVDSKPKRNAKVLEKLIKSGAIILAKTNLSEFAFYKGTGLPSGWSALGGQTQSAYTRGDVIPGDGFLGHSSPAGSSSGSAVGVSAGYAPISFGTDTTGSVVLPATRAALYALRLTQETAPMKGIIPISRSFDSLGPMAKCVQDLADVLDVIVDPSTSGVPAGGFSSSLPRNWSELRIGVFPLRTRKRAGCSILLNCRAFATPIWRHAPHF